MGVVDPIHTAQRHLLSGEAHLIWQPRLGAALTIGGPVGSCQVVRHRTLDPAFDGSNPSSPANLRSLRSLRLAGSPDFLQEGDAPSSTSRQSRLVSPPTLGAMKQAGSRSGVVTLVLPHLIRDPGRAHESPGQFRRPSPRMWTARQVSLALIAVPIGLAAVVPSWALGGSAADCPSRCPSWCSSHLRGWSCAGVPLVGIPRARR